MEYFKVSSGLKQIIGKDLITDKYVAIFELVKNSFDAKATRVDITFSNYKSNDAVICIKDNGIGMSRDDILNKWLFVAYSEKKESNTNQLYAGSKGVGRFSCDRLGRYLNIKTKTADDNKCNIVDIDWQRFEKNQNTEFTEIPIELFTNNDLSDFQGVRSGTVITLKGIPNDDWDRDDLLRLRRRLEKLIRPDLNKTIKDNNFEIFLNVPEELENDRKFGKDNSHRIVNGKIENFIFEVLNIKTTKIACTVSQDGKQITTTLFDKGVQVYKITEKNEFNLLSDISITLYFLNKSAKLTFSRRMGIQPVEYGNIFVYKNGFRIYPFGERGDDTLGIDNRAMQGYSRYLGSRNLIGQIDIQGFNSELKESTSRDSGLVKNKSYKQLSDTSPRGHSLLLVTLRRLEKFVVEIADWSEGEDAFDFSEDKDKSDKLLNYLANIDKKNLIKVFFVPDLLKSINLKKDDTKKLIHKVKNLVSHSEELELKKAVLDLENQLSKDKQELTKNLRNKTKALDKVELDNQNLVKENMFMRSAVSNETKEFESIQHHIYHSVSNTIPAYIDLLNREIERGSTPEKLYHWVGKISLENKKLIALTNYVTRANFKTTTTILKSDVVQFANEYTMNVYDSIQKEIFQPQDSVNIHINNPKKISKVMKFRPIEITIILENLFNNAKKAKAKNIELFWDEGKDKIILLKIKDDGEGIQPDILGEIFEYHFTTTEGSGLGLYHVKSIIDQLGWSIEILNTQKDGTTFVIEVR